ncbi:MAG: gamma-glutamyl-gamma-aminobutyrate hydrolase family protein [Streptococcaceae bacterium]|jgi:putative glutamine amidotransferase|nr:gamma-glutamyl-gamma-aminobutyrate hydrolase family protein [Streptococcaceae bacterium]
MAIIGILGTPFNIIEEKPFWWNKVVYTRQGFIDVFQKLGHTAIIIPVDKPENVKQYIDIVDRVLLTGGSDVSPISYGEDPHPSLGVTNIERDLFEFAAIEEAMKQDKPVLGICRGMQIMNVYLGGTLYQDLNEANFAIKHLQAPTPQEYPSHSISVDVNSSLSFLPNHYMVNSFHHQGVKKLAPSLKAIAHAADGIVEAVEGKEKRLLGVQWHPEATWFNKKEDKEVFRYFAEDM